MKGYVFISNTPKPTPEVAQSREPVRLTNVTIPCLEAALSMGYEVYLGINRDNPDEIDCGFPVHKFDSHTYRSLTAFSDNKIAYKNLCDVMRKADIDAIHCNTPIGGMIARLCARKFKTRKVLYTAHGFHFYKGAPLFNRTVLKWAEMIMARYTDAIITLNSEDFEAAKRFKLRNGGRVYYVHGVGIDTSLFSPAEKVNQEKRLELGIPSDAFVIISTGELNTNKNNSVIISAMEKLHNKKIHYVLCGVGEKLAELQAQADAAGLHDNVHFLGYRNDVKELYAASDCFAMPSLREGLSRSMMEAMASGLPCVASAIRGNVDLITDGEGGFLRQSHDADGFAEAINKLANDSELRTKMREYNLKKIREYDISVVKKEIADIYNEVFGE